jgi:hypothetical protein
MTLPYETFPSPPEAVDGPGVLARFVDSMGFRYRWATEGLTSEAMTFRAVEGAMTLGEVLGHLCVLVRWTESSVRSSLAGENAGSYMDFVDVPKALDDLRADTLEGLVELRTLFAGADPELLAAATITGHPNHGPQPFWCVLNGPLADFLNHVGQVASWRRMAGNPVPSADLFRGMPPATEA